MERHDDIHSQSIADLLKIRAHPMRVRRNKDEVPVALNWASGERPDDPGIYAFWWRHGLADLWKKIENRTVAFHGAGGAKAEQILLKLEEQDFYECDGMVPLYVGKTHQPIAKRIGQHLMLKSDRHIPLNRGHEKHNRKTTSCQLRDRIERLFHAQEDTRNLILKNVALSWVEIPCWKRRFFFEDYAIGYYRPLFNLDCER